MPLAGQPLTRREGRRRADLRAAEVRNGAAGAGGPRVADRDGESVGRVVRRGRLGQAEEGRDHSLDLALVRRAGAADRLLHGLRRVVEAGQLLLGGGQHAEATFLPKKRSSSAIALGSCHRISSPSESWRRASRFSTDRSEGVSITPPSSATIRSPDVRTTPNPVLAVPGSIPMTITLPYSHSPPGCPPAEEIGSRSWEPGRRRALRGDLF